MKRLLIIAAGVLEAEALRRALRYTPNVQIIGFAESSRPCGLTVRQARPDVILVNAVAAEATALERIAEARAEAPEATIVCRTHHLKPSWPHEVAEAGADATVDGQIDGARMAMLVREIAAGTVFHLPRASAREQREPTEAAARLTARELEILRLMAGGATNSSVAQQLWVTEQTVKFHLSNIYRKLGVANRTEASHYAHTHGLLAPVALPRPVDAERSPAVAAA
jgi:DNA-binding NarL/FixJ family response regulator